MINLFVTGTDYGTGKTFISAGLAATMQSLGYSTCVYKPIQTGAVNKNGFVQSPDLLFVKNVDPYVKTYSSYLLKEKADPSIAAEFENILIDKNALNLDFQNITKEHDCTIVDGTGGLAVPLAPGFVTADLIKTFSTPTVLVIKPDLGTVNQTLLTINQAKSSGLNVRGVIINDFPEIGRTSGIKAVPRLIEEYSDAKILGIIPHFQDIQKLNPNDLLTSILNGIDIESVFNVKIAKLEIQ